MIDDLLEIKRKFILDAQPLIAKSIRDLLKVQEAKEALFRDKEKASHGLAHKYNQL